MSPPLRVAIYGTGRLAGSLARALTGSPGVRFVGIAGRARARAESLAAAVGVPARAPEELPTATDLLLIAVSDAAIEGVARSLATVLRDGGDGTSGAVATPRPRWVAHCSGALGPDPLEPLATLGWAAATWHPLQAFPTPGTPVAPGTTWTITTDDAALDGALRRLTDALGGVPHALATVDRAAYHAAAVLAANYPAGLIAHAVEVLTGCGFAPAEALEAVLPLARSALQGLTAAGVPGGLTGPVVRGDVATITSHLRALDDRPVTRDLYRAAGLGILPFAQARGLDGGTITRLRAALTGAADVP